MPEQNELQIILSLVDEASGKLKAITENVKKDTKDISAASDKASKSLKEGFKDAGKELKDFRRAMFAVTVEIGFIIAATREWAKHNTVTRDSYDALGINIKKVFAMVGSIFAPAVQAFSKLIAENINMLQGLFRTVQQGYAWLFDKITFATQYWIALAAAMAQGVGLAEAHKIAMGQAAVAAKELGFEFKQTFEENIPQVEEMRITIKKFNEDLERQKLLFLDGRLSADDYYNTLINQGTAALMNKQLQVQIMQEVAVLENQVNNKTLLEWIRVMNQKKVLLEEFKNRVLMTWGQVLSGISSALGTLESALSGATEMGRGFAKAAAAIAMAMAIINVAQGITKAYSDYSWPFSMFVAGLIAAAGAIQIATIAKQKFHEGGLLRAHSGLAVDEVPIIAQTGEGILSRRGMGALGGVGMLNRLNSGQGSGAITYNIHNEINYPQLRSYDDIDTLTEEISKRISHEIERIS